MTGKIFIPETITVHKGPPGSNEQNVILSFLDYIKTVASCEICPVWPENVIRALIYVQISHTLYRYFTKWYRLMGYSYDITSCAEYDQPFVYGHVTFDNINRIVDDIFPYYIHRQDINEPCCARYISTILSSKQVFYKEWLQLFENDLSVQELLQKLYKNPIVFDIAETPSSFQLDNSESDIRIFQIMLNRISSNYPNIPKIDTISGIFDENTENAVLASQKIFGNDASKIPSTATQYHLLAIYKAGKQLSNLDSIDISLTNYPREYPGVLRFGDVGKKVRLLQFYLAVIGSFYPLFTIMDITDTFDAATENAVIAFQKAYNLTPDGIIGQVTWLDMERAYNGAIQAIPYKGGFSPYPKNKLHQGSMGDDVRLIQSYLTAISTTFPEIPQVYITGLYGGKMLEAIRTFQKELNIPITGTVDSQTWECIGNLYSDLIIGNTIQSGQYPGYSLAQT